MKNTLKKSKTIKRLYSSLLLFLRAFVPHAWAQLTHVIAYGKRPKLKEPKTFSEKLLWLSLNDYRNNLLVMNCSDKYLVREYVEKCGHKEVLNTLYSVWEKPSDIDWESLPESFALKLSQGWNTNIICSNKLNLDITAAQAKVINWHKGQRLYDRVMAGIGGVRVRDLKKYYIAEKYLGTNQNEVPVDYKFYCFNGKPMAILVISDRYSGQVHGCFMDTEWNYLAPLKGYYSSVDTTFSQPESLVKMLKIASELSVHFPFVRVDFYEYEGEPVLGELTFFPNGCVNMQETAVNGVSMGDLLALKTDKDVGVS